MYIALFLYHSKHLLSLHKITSVKALFNVEGSYFANIDNTGGGLLCFPTD